MIQPHPTLETRYVDHPSPYVLPWWTRPSLAWLLEQPVRAWSVLEWGCGLSSVWFNQAARRYVGIESNPAHAIAPGVTVVETRDGLTDSEVEADLRLSPYVEAGMKHGAVFDLVVVDGIYRQGCLKVAPRLLLPHGRLVVDNANWFNDWVAVLRPLFSGYERFVEPGRDPEWATDVYTGLIAPF